ncbi:MAG TPA: hypothetical protein VL400_25670 [Polyangiaceae bacterium]|nr:hypothetical protein [Polyangiaceae bacterium]
MSARRRLSIELPVGALRARAKGGRVRFASGAFELTGELARGGWSDGVELAIEHPIRRPRQLFVPHLSPEDGQVAGDAVFRAPAFIAADDRIALALVVDLDDVRDARGVRLYLDYDHRARRLVLGAGDYEQEGHVFYRRRPVAASGQRVRARLHLLASASAEDLRDPFRMATRFLWRRWGRPLHEKGGSARAPLATSMEHVVRWAFSADGWRDVLWQSFELDGVAMGAPAFIVHVGQHPSIPPAERTWREPRSIWNQAWFSTQRCANGLLRYARRTKREDLESRAHAMTEVALAAPSVDGLFPAVLWAAGPEDDPWGRVRWTGSDRRPPSVSGDACHLVDAAFTSRMLLEWHALTADARALAMASRCADRLVRLQRPSGAFPGWVEPDGRVPPELADSAESAVTVALLLDLDARGLLSASGRAAVERGLKLLESVIRDARWEDFETYWSCAPWGAESQLGRRVARNGVYKQNTLSIAWCADAMRLAHLRLGWPGALATAERCLDELSLYQAVWDPPWLPAPAHGGFGVMNADSEWNDARQSLFAPLYLDMFLATGRREYAERGVASLRASFSMLYAPEHASLARAYEARFPFFGPESFGFMMENQGHGGEGIGTFTIFSWGNGAALATAATLWDRFGDVIGDARSREGDT